MKRVKNHIIPLFSLFIYEVCYFIFVPYPKNLFDVRLMNSAYKYTPDFITKFILLILYIIIVNIIFKYVFFNEKYLFIKDFFKNIVIDFVCMLPVRLIFDIIISITPQWKYTYAEQFIVDLSFNIILFLFVFKKSRLYSKKIRFNKKTVYLICIMCLVSVLYIFISVSKVTQSIEYINYLSKKYLTISIQDELQNISFKISLYTLLFNIISIIILYFIFSSMVVRTIQSDTSKAKIIARIFSIIIIFILLFIIKGFLLPKNLLHKVIVESTETLNYQEQKNYDKNYKVIKIYRSDGYNKDILVYSKNIVYITYENKTILKVEKDNSQSIGKIVNHGNEIFSYDTQAIMYMDNNKPICVLSKDIVTLKENQKLTQVLETLIGTGYFEFLEYSYEYMLKYDKNYLESFLKKYAQGNYIENKNYNINRTYIMEFAQKSLQKDF